MKRLIDLLCLSSLVIVLSCNSRVQTETDIKEREKTDSIVALYKDAESLDSLSKSFLNTNNFYGYLSANKSLGKYYRHKGDFAKSIEISKINVKKSMEFNDTTCLIEALNEIGTNYRRMGILEEASSFHHKALEISEKFSDKSSRRAKKNRVISLNGLGNVYLTVDNRVLADSIFRLALAGETELGSWLGQAINYANIGALFETDGVRDSAIYYFSKSLECNIKCKSDVGIALCYTHFGRIYEEQGKWEEAIKQYRKAYDVMYEKTDRWHWLEACISLARVYASKNDIDRAMQYNMMAAETANELKSIEHITATDLIFSDIYEKRGDYKTALKYFREGKKNSDKLVNEKEKNSITEQRINYINSSKQDQISLLKQNYDSERKIRHVFVISTILLVTALGFIIVMFSYITKVRNKNRKQLAIAENARRTFFTNITHEFRTPLTVILGLGRRLNEGRLDAEESIEEISSMIVRQSNNLLTLVNQLLDISKVKSAINTPDWYRGNIVPYMQMLCDNHRYSTREKHIELHFEAEKKNITVEFVPDYLRKVMRNLISNAIKFTPEYGKIYITLSQEGEELKIIVADTGKGISESDLKHVFDIYYQSSNNKSELGSGVGLSLVKLIINSIGGSITVKSTLGKGTVFIITAPTKSNFENIKTLDETLYESREEQNSLNKDMVALPDGNVSDETSPIVLIIEDNHDIAYYIGSELKNKYRLYYSDNGREGLNTALDIIPDLIITDIMMPEMDGYEVCREVRNSDLLNHIPIIVITAKSTEEDKIKGVKAGADVYLFKPFNSEELNARVENLIELRMMLRNKYQQSAEQGNQILDNNLSETDKKLLAKINDHVYSMMSSGNVSCETVAEKMNMTARQLNRKISAITGENSSSYLMRVRLNKALNMLDTQPDLMINEIAYKCGFEDNAYFSRIFKKYFDITPSQYRKSPKIK